MVSCFTLSILAFLSLNSSAYLIMASFDHPALYIVIMFTSIIVAMVSGIQ